ncbi:MAG TPA: protoporphyrinogen oxidase [Phycisphaerae bacterium]|nr:protoporphyrinogen oxidase [Phycisphaerae bacterium]
MTATLIESEERDVIVVGGGISGLTVAWHLRRAGVDVALLEAGPRVGGSIQTERRDGFLLEKGPFNVIVRDPAFEELLAGLADRINVVTASPQAENRYIYRHGDIHVVPTNPIKLFHSPLLTFGGACRAVRGLFFSKRGRREETTLEEFAVRRFGREVADTLLSAVVAGILAGDIGKLSAYACFPMLRDFDQKSVSPLGRTARRIPSMIRKRWNPNLRRKWRGLVSIDSGLGGLCEAIASMLGADVHTGCRVEFIDPTDDGFLLRVGGTDKAALSVRMASERDAAGTYKLGQHSGRGHGQGSFVRATLMEPEESFHQREFHCRRLVLATPACETARQLQPIAPEASRLLAGIESSSLTVVNLAFRRSDVGHPLDGFGFLVPRNEPDFPLMGVLWADSAFPHHAPPEYRLMRAFFGGARTPDVIRRSADELVRTACTALGGLLDIHGEPVFSDVCPYPDAIPQYYLGHERKVAELRRAVARVPGLALAGNYLDGVSINDCIKLGRQVAVELINQPRHSPTQLERIST